MCLNDIAGDTDRQVIVDQHPDDESDNEPDMVANEREDV